MPEISLPPWLQFKPGSEAVLDAINTGTQEERARTSNFTELGRLKLAEQENQRQNDQEARAKALFPLVQQENQFKMDSAALNLAMNQERMRRMVNGQKGGVDLVALGNDISDKGEWGTARAATGLAALLHKYPGLGDTEEYGMFNKWNDTAQKGRQRIDELQMMQDTRFGIEEERSANRLDVADANNAARIERFNSPFGRKFANTVKMEEYDALTKKLITNPTPENVEEFRVWKQINRVDLKEDPIAMIQKYQLTEESKAIQRSHTGEIEAIKKDPNTNTAQKQQAIERVELATRKKLADGRKAYLDAQVHAAMPNIVRPTQGLGKSGFPLITTKEEYDALAPGAAYEAPDGSVRPKPLTP